MEARERLLDKYSARVFKNRKDHVITKAEDATEIAANSRTIPGIMTNRGCCYAGCKGVVLGPLKDVAVITHGPIGCAFYSWGTRRHKAKGDENTKNFLEYCFSTDMQESDIVFGGEKKLRQAIQEVVEIFDPASIMICSTCPVGLIGDDINAVAAEAEKLYNRKVIAFSCEGYKGVSQSGGHHIANNGLIRHVIGTGDRPVKKYAINILGEYNIGGDGWEISRVLKRIGYDIVSVMTGDGSYAELKNAHLAELNVVQCHRSINYIAEMLKTKYGTDWIKVNFIGVSSMIKSLRDMAKYFGDEELIAKTEEVIAEELEAVSEELEYYKSRLKGKTAALFVGGSRSHHYQKLLKDLGVETVLAGYEFAHRDDYEGREVIPFIKEDADSKNIESIKVSPDEAKYKIRLSETKYNELKDSLSLEYYEGMIKEMENGAIIVDDLNHFETEEFLNLLKPDVFYSGIKDKYVAQKGGILSRQLHSYDYSGPYASFKGAVNFARDTVMGIYTPAWKYVTAPWKTEPTLEGTLTGGEQSA
ncbi:MAG: nitrogenase molybdenum-iron protein alpha chain [Clostridiales bacterium 43-6]|nr:MAG: nitrogenase molybdenum-iron protein alpha chain [Clostridiales bacterium 43-6]